MELKDPQGMANRLEEAARVTHELLVLMRFTGEERVAFDKALAALRNLIELCDGFDLSTAEARALVEARGAFIEATTAREASAEAALANRDRLLDTGRRG